jgi:hypothetical protein
MELLTCTTVVKDEHAAEAGRLSEFAMEVSNTCNILFFIKF